MNIYLRSCSNPSGRKDGLETTTHLLESECVYHFGRYCGEAMVEEKKDPSGLRHFQLALPSAEATLAKRAFSLIFSKNKLRIIVHNPNGVLVQGKGIGKIAYAKGEIGYLPLISELRILVMGELLKHVETTVTITELENNSTLFGKISRGMSLEHLQKHSYLALDRSRSRDSLIVVLLYLATLLHTRCYGTNNIFPSVKELGNAAEKYLSSLAGEKIEVTAKQLTEAGKTAAAIYYLPVSASAAWVEIPQMLLRLGMLIPEENQRIWKYLQEKLGLELLKEAEKF